MRPTFQLPATSDAMPTPRAIRKDGNTIKSEYRKNTMATIGGRRITYNSPDT